MASRPAPPHPPYMHTHLSHQSSRSNQHAFMQKHMNVHMIITRGSGRIRLYFQMEIQQGVGGGDGGGLIC